MSSKLVEIIWKDSARNSSTYTEKELIAFQVIEVHTLGYAIELEDRWVGSAECYPEDESFRGVWSIPKVNIVKVNKLYRR